jgi:hypothetical protein
MKVEGTANSAEVSGRVRFCLPRVGKRREYFGAEIGRILG